MSQDATIVDKIRALANSKGMSLPILESSLGLGNGTISRWNKGAPNTGKLAKVADYFNVSIDYLLGREDKKDVDTSKIEHSVSDNDIKFALFGDSEIDDEIFESVKNFAKFAAEQKRKKKEGE